MTDKKYKLTMFKNRFATTGRMIERTLGEIYLGFKNNYKRTKEKFAEYQNADRATKAKIKDVGGFIGGETEGDKRINGIKITRELLTLDIDTKTSGVLEYLKRNIDFICIVYSTHSHSESQNRYRIVAPLSREVNADEYEAIGRRIAYNIEHTEIEDFPDLFDETTFQANRLMFLPSVSLDGDYVCELLNLDFVADEQKVIDVDRILDEYNDSKDIYEWYKPEKADITNIGRNTLINKSPLKAKGMIGAFNRTYSITQAIDKFLSKVYKKERSGRYTFIGGDSHGGGLVLNNDTIFYSHHGTDPANLYYRSAFDLVRIHMFGKMDNSFTPEKEIEDGIYEKTASFSAMVEFCRELEEVVANSDQNIALRQRLEKQEKYVSELFEDEDKVDLEEEVKKELDKIVEKQKELENIDNKSWLTKLEGIKSKAGQLAIILENDPILNNLFYYDTFRANICFSRIPFWYRGKEFVIGQSLQDKDMSHIRIHLDKVYDIKGKDLIEDSIVVEADKIHKNKVLDWFESIKWDGTNRLETFFQDYFKVKQNPFTKVAFKHWMVGAVSRIYKAGSPMDLVLIIKGKQGIGKSLFFKRLATPDFGRMEDHLYSDTKIDFNKSKDSYEQLEGIWIYEWKELAGMNMSDQESIKAFVDKTEDKFRRSYGRRNVEIKRRVAFGGTTNERTPLRDRTGNRRFLVMESNLEQNECLINKTNVFTQEYRDQLIAEAVVLYKKGFKIQEWTEEEYEWWEKSNEDNLTENELVGQIKAYLEMKKPKAWYSMNVEQMLDYVKNYDFENEKSHDYMYKDVYLEPMKRACIKELWQVAMKQRDVTLTAFQRTMLVQAIEQSGWMLAKSQLRFGVFGQQIAVLEKEEPDLGF